MRRAGLLPPHDVTVHAAKTNATPLAVLRLLQRQLVWQDTNTTFLLSGCLGQIDMTPLCAPVRTHEECL